MAFGFPGIGGGGLGSIGTSFVSQSAQFAKLGLGAPTTSSNTDPNVVEYITRSGTGGGIGQINLAFHSFFTAAPAATEVTTSSLFDVFNTGSATATGGHMIGAVGRAQDTISGDIPINGIEGKIIRASNTNNTNTSAGVWGLSDFNGSSFTGGTLLAFKGYCEVYNGTTSSPVAQGTTIVYRAFAPTGGDPTRSYALVADAGMQILVGGTITSTDSTGAKNSRIYHNGTDGYHSVTSGNLIIDAPGAYAVLNSGTNGFAPASAGAQLGFASFGWNGYFNQFTLLAQASVTPANNGEMMIQLTSNTSLTFKVKGSDGTVRSASLTLA